MFTLYSNAYYWIANEFFTVPTTCSRRSTKMSAFIHACVIRSCVLPRPFNYKSWKFGDELGEICRVHLGIGIFCPTHCVVIVATWSMVLQKSRRKLGNISKLFQVFRKALCKYLENLERIQTLSWETYFYVLQSTQCVGQKLYTELHFDRHITSSITKFSALIIKRSGQDTSYGSRMHE